MIRWLFSERESISYSAVSYRIVSYRIVSYHIISYHERYVSLRQLSFLLLYELIRCFRPKILGGSTFVLGFRY